MDSTITTPTALGGTEDDGGSDTSYLVIALAAGIPCGIVIILLVAIIVFMMLITVRGSRSQQEEIEATYMQRRFQGLSLAEQKRMSEQRKKKKKKRFVSRRRSSAAESKASSTMTPNARRAKVRRVNPFGLQDWQLRMSGIEPETEETDIDGEEEGRTLGAFNPLMMRDDTDFEPDYEAVKETTHNPNRRATAPAATALTQTPSSSAESGSDSSDSFNPYD